jgi:regulatory protein
VTTRRSSADAPPPPRPLDPDGLERLALSYVGRYATSRAGLRRYLRRKIAERGWAADTPPEDEAIVERLAGLGYVDDRAIAEARGRSLARRGYGAYRLSGALGALGIEAGDAAAALASARDGAWQTALRFAEKRRIGPFARGPTDQPAWRRGFAAMIRAGHAADIVRKIMNAPLGIVPDRDE